MTHIVQVCGRLLWVAWVAALIVTALTAHAVDDGLLTSDGNVNLTCGTTPRPIPLPVPTKMIPPQIDMPAQLKGTGTAAITEANGRGMAVGWWVPHVEGATLYLYAVTWRYLTDHPGLAAKIALLAVVPGSDAASVAAIGAAYDPVFDIRDMCDVWFPMVAALNASRPPPLPANPPPPPAAVYEVTPDGSKPDRQYFPATQKTDGAWTRSVTSPGRIAKLTVADCARIQIIEYGITRYCAVLPPGNFVAAVRLRVTQ